MAILELVFGIIFFISAIMTGIGKLKVSKVTQTLMYFLMSLYAIGEFVELIL